jgi:hypothetical protein
MLECLLGGLAEPQANAIEPVLEILSLGDEDTVEEWQEENSNAGLPHWFCENLLVFRRPVAVGKTTQEPAVAGAAAS